MVRKNTHDSTYFGNSDNSNIGSYFRNIYLSRSIPEKTSVQKKKKTFRFSSIL